MGLEVKLGIKARRGSESARGGDGQAGDDGRGASGRRQGAWVGRRGRAGFCYGVAMWGHGWQAAWVGGHGGALGPGRGLMDSIGESSVHGEAGRVDGGGA